MATELERAIADLDALEADQRATYFAFGQWARHYRAIIRERLTAAEQVRAPNASTDYIDEIAGEAAQRIYEGEGSDLNSIKAHVAGAILKAAAEQVRGSAARELTADDLASALMDAHNVPERAPGDSETISDAIKEAQSILDALPWKLYLQPAEQASWPTEAMIDAAEMKMPQLGRVQIRFLFETMMAASSGTAEQVRGE